MKKIAALALTAALAGSLAVPALAAEAPVLISAPVDGYTTQITLNGETVDTAGIPAASADTMLPLRLVAESDHGSAYWDEENNEGWFYFGDNRIVVKFADNSVWINDEQVKSTAYVTAGVTFVESGVLAMLEGYTVEWADPTAGGFQAVSVTTPNNDPMVKLAYEIQETCNMAFGMEADEQTLTDAYGIPAGSFEQVVAFFPMITSPDTLVVGKLAEGADVDAVKEALETYRQGQEDTFSWYLGQHLPKVQDARLVVEGDYLFFLIAADADAGEAAFTAFVEAQG